jgi:hypothetical protein
MWGCGWWDLDDERDASVTKCLSASRVSGVETCSDGASAEQPSHAPGVVKTERAPTSLSMSSTCEHEMTSRNTRHLAYVNGELDCAASSKVDIPRWPLSLCCSLPAQLTLEFRLASMLAYSSLDSTAVQKQKQKQKSMAMTYTQRRLRTRLTCPSAYYRRCRCPRRNMNASPSKWVDVVIVALMGGR